MCHEHLIHTTPYFPVWPLSPSLSPRAVGGDEVECFSLQTLFCQVPCMVSWVEWCTTNVQCVMNTWFKNHHRRLWTWLSPDGHTKNQVDYFTVNKRFRSPISDCKTYPGADCSTDHRFLVANMVVKLKSTSKMKASPKLKKN